MTPIRTVNATTVLLIAASGRSVQRLLDSRERDNCVALEEPEYVYKASECLLRRRYGAYYGAQTG